MLMGIYFTYNWDLLCINNYGELNLWTFHPQEIFKLLTDFNRLVISAHFHTRLKNILIIINIKNNYVNPLVIYSYYN